jgi:2,5-dihydroxypyridine 5,6-dioxygenase
LIAGIRNIAANASGLVKGEKALILANPSTSAIAKLFQDEISRLTGNIETVILPETAGHGTEPSIGVRKAMMSSDVIFCLTKCSLAHTESRKLANREGARFLSLPDYSGDMLKDPSLRTDFRKLLPQVKKTADILTKGKMARVTSAKGTDIQMHILGRAGNCCPGFVDKNHKLGSPPDVEANIAPIEDKSEGVIVVDGSITYPGIGLLSEDVVLEVRRGMITGIASRKYSSRLLKIMDNRKKRILAELGIGLNHRAKICGNMLIDEGAKGCIHFGFGSNSTIGGRNDAGFHLDFIVKRPSLHIDGRIIVKEGVIHG